MMEAETVSETLQIYYTLKRVQNKAGLLIFSEKLRMDSDIPALAWRA
jgi:hypothetical protein